MDVKETKYKLFDKVKVKPFKTEGVVLGILFDCEGVKYSVRSIYDSSVHRNYFFEWELEFVEKAKKEDLGFLLRSA